MPATAPATPASEPTPAKPVRRLLLTGAAGGLGRVLRPRLAAACETLRVSDIADLGAAAAAEELQPARLENLAEMLALLSGVDAVVHLGGVSTEQPFSQVLPANIVGVYNLYEAARIHGVHRVVFASSNHVTGFYKQSETINPTLPVRPDGYYGVSKVFGESLAQFYFDRYGLETVSLRIGSSWPEPVDRRMLATWLSHDDLERLVLAALTAPVVGHSIVYGVSNNPVTWWDNTSARHLGFHAHDSSAPFHAGIEARQPQVDTRQPQEIYQGGGFVIQGPFPTET